MKYQCPEFEDIICMWETMRNIKIRRNTKIWGDIMVRLVSLAGLRSREI